MFERTEKDCSFALFVFKIFPTKTPFWKNEDGLFSTLAENIEDWSIVPITAHENESLIIIEIEENFLRDLNIKITLAS